MKDYFKILGVSRSADDRIIKRAFREVAKKYHPDVYDGDPARFLVASEANRVLLCPELKSKHLAALNRIEWLQELEKAVLASRIEGLKFAKKVLIGMMAGLAVFATIGISMLVNSIHRIAAGTPIQVASGVITAFVAVGVLYVPIRLSPMIQEEWKAYKRDKAELS